MGKGFATIVALVLFWGMNAQESRFEDENAQNSNPKPSANASSLQSSTPSENFWKKVHLGGNIGLQFGAFTFVNISPRAFYTINDNFWTGLGASFIYAKNNIDYGYTIPDAYRKQVVYGGNLFAGYQIFEPFFVQAEYEPLNFERLQRNYYGEIVGEERTWNHNLLLGGGVFQRVGNGGVMITVLYNATYSNSWDNYYPSPWVYRMGFFF